MSQQEAGWDDKAASATSLHRLASDGACTTIDRFLAVEAPVSIEYNGIAYAVMMATPADLEDFIIGFSLSEGIITTASEVLAVEIAELSLGWVVRVTLPPALTDHIMDRARMRVSEGSCGLCGLENLEQVMRPLPAITAIPTATQQAIFTSLSRLSDHQPLSRLTGAAHAAAFCGPQGDIRLVREDVGRHNALDKLIGALARAEVETTDGFFLLTARCSYELVEKTILARCPLLVTISAPSSMAVERAKAHDLTLIALARPDAVLVAHDPHARFTGHSLPTR